MWMKSTWHALSQLSLMDFMKSCVCDISAIDHSLALFLYVILESPSYPANDRLSLSSALFPSPFCILLFFYTLKSFTRLTLWVLRVSIALDLLDVDIYSISNSSGVNNYPV